LSLIFPADTGERNIKRQVVEMNKNNAAEQSDRFTMALTSVCGQQMLPG
jgi:hypothetical protein